MLAKANVCRVASSRPKGGATRGDSHEVSETFYRRNSSEAMQSPQLAPSVSIAEHLYSVSGKESLQSDLFLVELKEEAE